MFVTSIATSGLSEVLGASNAKGMPLNPVLLHYHYPRELPRELGVYLFYSRIISQNLEPISNSW